MALPGLAIHQSVKLTKKIVETPKYNFTPKIVARSPVAVGLLMIPLIVKPIDHFVDNVMDNYIRPSYPSYVQEDFKNPQDFIGGLHALFSKSNTKNQE